jgi:5-methylcytosine-specific restriction endonuclease McrA
MSEGKFDPSKHLSNKVRGGADGRKRPKSPEHRAKIAAALRRYAQRPDSHLHAFHGAGEAHPNWQGGIKPEYYQRIAFAAHGRACQRCGSTRHLNVHHKDENRRNSKVGNLEVLCRSCHNREHGLGGRHAKR